MALATSGIDIMLTEVEQAIRAGLWEDALRLASDLVRRHPENPQARVYLGVAHMHFAEFERAADHLRSAVALKPHFWQAELLLAQCLDMLGSYEEALEVAKATLKERPSDKKVQSLVRGLERQVEEPITDGWQVSLKPPYYNIDLTTDEQDPKKGGQQEPEAGQELPKPQLKLFVRSPEPTN